MTSIEQSSGPKQSLMRQLFGVHLAMITLVVLTVLGRVFVRMKLIICGFGNDDAFILTSLVMAITFVTINLLTEVTGIIVRYRAFRGPLLEDCIATDTVYIH